MILLLNWLWRSLRRGGIVLLLLIRRLRLSWRLLWHILLLLLVLLLVLHWILLGRLLLLNVLLLLGMLLDLRLHLVGLH